MYIYNLYTHFLVIGFRSDGIAKEIKSCLSSNSISHLIAKSDYHLKKIFLPELFANTSVVKLELISANVAGIYFILFYLFFIFTFAGKVNESLARLLAANRSISYLSLTSMISLYLFICLFSLQSRY